MKESPSRQVNSYSAREDINGSWRFTAIFTTAYYWS